MFYLDPAVAELGIELREGVRIMNHELTTAEKEQLRTTSLFVIGRIAGRFGGVVEVDLETNSLVLDVPDEKREACARAIDAAIDPMCRDAG